MPVYMIRAGQVGPVKIGHSINPAARMVEIQVAHYEKLQIIRLFDGGAAEEAMLHMRFSDLHIRGEWHSFSRLMLGDVGLKEIEEERPKTPLSFLPESGISLDEILATLGGDRAVADALQCGQSSISNWKCRGIPPRRQMQIAELARNLALANPITLEEIRAANKAIEDMRQVAAAIGEPA